MQSPVTVGLSVRLSVRLSVTRWHWVKTTQARSTKSSPTDSPRTPVFGIKNSSRNSKGFTPSEGVKWEWGRKIRNFQPISHRISETVQDGAKSLLTTKRKSHTPFRLVSKSTTLDDREWPIHTLLQKRCVFRSPLQKFEWLSAAKMYANDYSFWRYKFYTNIRAASPGRGIKRQWGCRERQFSAFSVAIVRIL